MMQMSLLDVVRKGHHLFEKLLALGIDGSNICSPVVSTVLAEYVFDEM